MNVSPLLVIPGLVCLFWVFVHNLLAKNVKSYGVFISLFLITALTIAGNVLEPPLRGAKAIANIVLLFSAPSIIPLTCLYLAFLYKPFAYKPIHFSWFALPAITATAAIVLTSILGFDAVDAFEERFHSGLYHGSELYRNEVEQAYYIWTVLVFFIMTVIELVILATHCISLGARIHMKPKNLFDFLFRGGSIRVLELQIILTLAIGVTLCLKLFLPGNLFSTNMILALGLAIIQTGMYFMFGFNALFGAEDYVTWKQMSNAFRFNYSPETRSQFTEDIVAEVSGNLNGESLTRIVSRLGSQNGNDHQEVKGDSPANRSASLATAVMNNVVLMSRDKGSLVSRFRRLMMDEQLFLRPSLTLNDVADRLDTNKTYISKMVNQNYKMGFPELLNILRVDYAQQFIRSHPNATQEEIARECGFLSASSFNGTFKRVCGFTPKVWAARKDSTEPLIK